MNRMRKIFDIFEKYVSPDYRWIFFADFEVIGFSISNENITPEDAAKLAELDVFFDEDYQGWIMYV